ncbi:MAG: hypothetical protein J6D15_01430 [Clostridia bacterium]|nr:hypothetical protein [Clostridia bacterium]
MYKSKNPILSASGNGISFYVITGNADSLRPFGIMAEMDNDKSDAEAVENIFFTSEEAAACCKWLAENEVFPVTLCDVLGNFYPVALNY